MAEDKRPVREFYKSDLEFYTAVVEREAAIAKQIKTEAGYSTEDNFKPRVALIGPGFQVSSTPLVWGSEDEKNEAMTKAAYLTRAVGGKGIMVTSDMRYVRSDEFAEHFKIALPNVKDKASFARFQKEYLRVLKQHGGSMANLPRHLWSEVVGVALKTQDYGQMGRMAPYTRGTGGQVMWLPTEDVFEHGRLELKMIPDWWKIPDSDPNLVRAKIVAEMVLRAINVMAREDPSDGSPTAKTPHRAN